MQSKKCSVEFINIWLDLKKKAVKTGDLKMYKWFLKEMQKVFIKLYAEVKEPEAVLLVEQVLKINTCELKANMIKYNK